VSTTDELVERALAGDRVATAKLLSRVEQGGAGAREVVSRLHPHTGNAWSVGITGAPGAGKSTLTDALVACMRADGLEIGVLAVDPSSPFSGGAILGDRVRMQRHSTDPGVFIRSMASRGHLGGLAVATPQSIRVLDAVGKSWVVVETVGVGQVEVEIASQADTTLVVVNPGWGDAVQANKAGLLEIADVFVVNKADRDGVERVVAEIESMLSLVPGDGEPPAIVRTVATRDEGTRALADAIAAFQARARDTGALAAKRRSQLRRQLDDAVRRRLLERLVSTLRPGETDALVERIARRELDPFTAAEELISRVAPA